MTMAPGAKEISGTSPMATPGAQERSARNFWLRLWSAASAGGLPVVVLLAITIWIAHFSLSFHRGLYEDDWAFVGQPMGWTFAETLHNVWADLHVWPQGRPIGFAACPLFVFLGKSLWGLEGVYLIAFVLHVVNSSLLYFIVRRHLATAPAFCAALGFALFPSNTTVPLLEAQLFNGLTLLFLLLALWLYLNEKRLAAYVICCGSLLTYESAFLPFFAAPLLRTTGRNKIGRELLRHSCSLLLIAGALFWLRVHMGEAKVTTVVSSGMWGTISKVAIAVYSGSLTTFHLAGARLVTVLQNTNGQAALVFLTMAVGFTAALYLFPMKNDAEEDEVWPVSVTNPWFRYRATVTIDATSAAALRLIGSGLVMVGLAYCLAISQYYFPPVIEAGRLTGTHLSAGVGAGFVYGGLSALLFNLNIRRLGKVAVALIPACYFAALGGFHYLVQQDFATAWLVEQHFWQAVVRTCPDITDGTVLIYQDQAYPTRYILANSWGDGLVLSDIYKFPKDWRQPPQLFSPIADWTEDTVRSDDNVLWQAPPPWPAELLPEGNLIVLKTIPGKGLERLTGTIVIKSKPFHLKPAPLASGTPAFEHGPMYDYLLR